MPSEKTQGCVQFTVSQCRLVSVIALAMEDIRNHKTKVTEKQVSKMKE